MGALALSVQKCGSSRLKCLKRMVAFALKAQKYRSSHFERSKVIKGMLLHKALKPYGGSRFRSSKALELSPQALKSDKKV